MRHKISQHTEINARTLAALAAGETMPSHVRVSVVKTIRERPEILAELPALAARVPAAMAVDPFVGALRDLCRPTVRLPLRHREVLARVGEGPYGFLELVIEEARTSAWRTFDPAPLDSFLGWLPKAKLLTAEDIFVLGERASEARSLVAQVGPFFYAAAYQPTTFFDIAEEAQAHRERYEKANGVRPEAPGKGTAEGVFAQALYVTATTGEGSAAERLLLELDSASLGGDELVLLDLVKAWCFGILAKDLERAEFDLNSALAAVDEACDPWLELFLRVQLAWVINQRASTQVRSMMDIMAERMGQARMGLGGDPFAIMMKDYQNEIEKAWVHLKPALDHLNAASAMLAEFPAAELRLRFLELRMKLLVAHDLPQAMEDLIDAVVLAKKQPKKDPDDVDMRATIWMTDSMFYKAGLERLQFTQPRARAALERYVARVQPAVEEGYNLDTYGTKKAPPWAKPNRFTTGRK